MPGLPRGTSKLEHPKSSFDHEIPIRMETKHFGEISSELLPSPDAISTPKRSSSSFKLPELKNRSYSTKSSCKNESSSRSVSPIKGGVDNKSYSSKSSEIDLTLREPGTLEEKLVKPEHNISNLWVLDHYI